MYMFFNLLLIQESVKKAMEKGFDPSDPIQIRFAYSHPPFSRGFRENNVALCRDKSKYFLLEHAHKKPHCEAIILTIACVMLPSITSFPKSLRCTPSFL